MKPVAAQSGGPPPIPARRPRATGAPARFSALRDAARGGRGRGTRRLRDRDAPARAGAEPGRTGARAVLGPYRQDRPLRRSRHGRGGQSAGGGRRGPGARGGRQRGRCRDRGADGAEPGRASVLRHRRRRFHAALRSRERHADQLRRPRDRTGRRLRRHVRRRAAAAMRASSRRWTAGCRSAPRACCACWSRPIAGTAGCPGVRCSRTRSGCRSRGFGSRRAWPRRSPAPRQAFAAQGDPVASYFLNPDGTPKGAGTLLRNPELAATLRAVASGGADAFYSGAMARAIVDKVRGHPTNPGRLGLQDMAGYRAKERPALCGAYRAYRVCGMGPPSSGAIAVLQTLGILNAFDLRHATRPTRWTRCTWCPRPTGSPTRTARSTWPTASSSRCRSPACSIRATCARAPR